MLNKFRSLDLFVYRVSFKIITKVSMNRLSKVVSPVISQSHTGFVKGRYIMEGMVVLHEALNSIHHWKQNALLFKVDFERL